MFRTVTIRRMRAFRFAMAAAFLAIAAQASAGPALWKLSDDDNTVYLFGTFHLLPEGLRWQTDAVRQAMARAPLTVTEADTSSMAAQAEMQQLVMKHGLNAPGTTLSAILGDERARELFAVAAGLGIPAANLEPLRPWLALLTVTQAAYVEQGLNPALGVETIVLQAASEQGDTVEHLETLERQITALAALEGEGAIDFVDVSLEQFDEMERQVSEGIAAWAAGDTDTLNALLIEATRGESPRAFELIFTERNQEWVEKIAAYLDGDVDTFIAVGAGHLVGSDSVIELLAARGLQATRIQ